VGKNVARDTKQPSTVWPIPTLPEFLKAADKKPRWVVKGLVLDSAVMLCSGQKKRAGKSFVGMHTAIGMAAGVPFGLWVPEQRFPVIFCEEEGPLGPTADRLRACCRSLSVDPDSLTNLWFAHKHGLKLDDPKWSKKIIGKIQETGAKLMVLDALGYMHRSDENNTKDMQRIREGVLEATKQGCSVLMLHHLTKSIDPKIDADDQVRGSGVVTDQYDVHLVLRRYDEASPVTDFQLRFKDYEWKNYSLRWNFVNNADGVIQRADMLIEDREQTKQKRVAECVRRLAPDHKYSLLRLQEQWGLGQKQTKLMAENLQESGVLVKEGSSYSLVTSTRQAVNVSPA
jgi:RecA-family ATPase